MTHTFILTAEVRLSFTFGSEAVEWLNSKSPSLRSDAALELARELEEMIGQNYAVRSVSVEHEDALLIGTED